MTDAGTLPLRKPGMVTWEPISRYAFLRLGSSSANGTSIASRTLVGLRVSTVLFTGVLLDHGSGCRGRRPTCGVMSLGEPSLPDLRTGENSTRFDRGSGWLICRGGGI